MFCDECGNKVALSTEQPSKDLTFDEKLEKIQKYLPRGLTEKILSERDKIEGEKKQVTVMFCDMEGFTHFTEKLGPEEVYGIMDQVYETLIHKVHDYEGTVNEMTGDGIMALFGAPIALEDAPQRAIRSAYAIHREMVKFSDQIKKEKDINAVKMRIGIHTGPVVVGTLGNDLRVEFKAVGDTVNLASRMEGLAEPGTTYVTEDTFRLTEGLFRFEAMGEKEVQGKEKAVRIYRVIAPSSMKTRFDVSAERGLTQFVGRERELELLLDGLERSKQGRGQAISIMAEAGLGKSRLLYEFRKLVTHENVSFLEGKCLSYSRGIAYYPIIDVLKSNFNILKDDRELDVKIKVKKGINAIGVNEGNTLPYLLEMLSVKDSGIETIPMSPETKKDRILNALKQIVLKGSGQRPLIMAVEDLHWIDKTSENVLRYLLESISAARVLLIFTYRPEFVHTWSSKTYHSHVSLNRLSNRASLDMAKNLLEVQRIETNLDELILEKTEGVPFYIEEFIRSLKDLEVIEKRNDMYYLSRDAQTMAIPSRIHDVIMARVDCLSQDAKKILQIGSVIGREFDHNLLREVTKLPESELLSQLSRLKDFELLYERGIYPDSTYIFKHALTQDAAYQSLLTNTRYNYHRNIAQVLEQKFPEITETEPELLGHHFTEGGLEERAIPYWQQAGRRAIGRSTYEEAVMHLHKGLEALENLPDTPNRIQQELAMQASLGHAFLATKGLGASEAEQAFNRARELCQHAEETPEVFDVVLGLRRLYFGHAEHRTAKELGGKLIELAHNFKSNEFLIEAYRLNGSVLYNLGELTTAKSHLEKALSMYDQHEHHSFASLYGSDPAVSALSWLSLTLWELGFPDQALSASQNALTLGQELSHAYSIALALSFSPHTHQYRREVEITREQAEKAILFSTEQKFPWWLARSEILYGWSLVQQGKCEDGIAMIEKGIEATGDAGGKISIPYYLSMLVEAYKILRQIDKGYSVLKEALKMIEATGERYWEAELYRLKGELILCESENNHQKAESCFRRAIDIANSQEAKSLELRAAMSLSKLLQTKSKKEEARQLLSEIYGWFTEGFDTADLKDAKALIYELS
jgi:predicted ATPase/class 3 adenylate cyclase